jgi:hypothetical protein
MVLHHAAGQRGTMVLSEMLDRKAEPAGDEIKVRGDEGVIVELDSS